MGKKREGEKVWEKRSGRKRGVGGGVVCSGQAEKMQCDDRLWPRICVPWSSKSGHAYAMLRSCKKVEHTHMYAMLLLGHAFVIRDAAMLSTEHDQAAEFSESKNHPMLLRLSQTKL